MAQAPGTSNQVEIEVKISETLFAEEQIKRMAGYNRGHDYVEVRCGCTSRRFGDCMGVLRVFATGQFVISCECTPGCREEKLTPYEFEKHSRKEGTSNWSSHIWVLINDLKKPLKHTELNKYYKHAANGASGPIRRNYHRDEFIRCSKCKKERRFRLRTKEQCRLYHDASLKKRWKCADKPHDKISCQHDEERPSRKLCRGCPQTPNCEGCSTCVCIGCLKCRFLDCNCRTCTDFMQNAPPS